MLTTREAVAHLDTTGWWHQLNDFQKQRWEDFYQECRDDGSSVKEALHEAYIRVWTEGKNVGYV